MHTNPFSSDSIGNNNLDSAKKTNMSEKNNHKKSNPIHPKQPSTTKKFAKPTFSPIPPSTKKIMSSITSSRHTISESPKTNCKRTYLI